MKRSGVEDLIDCAAQLGEPMLRHCVNGLRENDPKHALPEYRYEFIGAWILCEMADPRAAEPVVQWLLREHGVPEKDQGRPLSHAEQCRRRIPLQSWQKLFGDLAEPLLDLKCWKAGANDDKADLSACLSAVAALCVTNTPLTSNLLHEVAGLKNALITQDSFEKTYQRTTYTRRLDFGALRDVAQRELRARGNPRRDPSAYRSSEAWHARILAHA